MIVKDGNNAPEERVNLVYKTDTGPEQPGVELPLRLMVIGDFMGRAIDEPLRDRVPIEIKQKSDFDVTLKANDVRLNAQVKNVLDGPAAEEKDLDLRLTFSSLKDFEPEEIAKKIPKMRELLEIREALMELKGPLANEDAFRRKIEALLADPESRSSILDELELGPSPTKAD